MLDKTFDPKKIEETQYKTWESSGVFQADPASKTEPFTIMMPPPNVTGSLHIGHALNHTLQDILVRYERMRGKDVLWQPGTDHASIAVHMVLEKQLAEEGKDRFTLGRDAFLEKAWKWKEYSGSTITSQLRRLGTTPDWSRERFTMDEGLSKAVLKAFVDLYKDGLIYRAERLVNWDPERQTVISDLEVIQKEQKGNMWHIRYPVEGEVEQFITVATTRPETMFGDTAVAVHPEDERYQHMIGKSVVLPITGRMIPIVADEHSDPAKGSGAVKITPAHDFNDFEVGQRHDLPMVSVFDEKACILPLESIPAEYHGLDRFEARKKVVAELESLDLLVEIESIKNTIPVGERSGVVIEPFLTKQWFCDTPTLAKPAAQAVRDGKTSFTPKQYENMYFDWVDNQLPWCISRQLWWGHQIPAWYGPDGEVFVAETEDEAHKDADVYYGESVSLTRESDVLDTWFSSALWPFSTLGWPEETPELSKYYPGDVLVTGFDIITFWVSRMMMFSLYFMDGQVPFKTVYIHALVRDAQGQKMSKSKGNVMDPLDVIEKYGTDALRFTLAAMAAQGRDIRLSEERIQGYRNFATKLWNATRFCQMNECAPVAGFDPASAKLTVNQWIIHSVAKAKSDFEAALGEYRFNDAANVLYHFVWGAFCDWYLEFTKPVFEEGAEIQITETRAVTGWALDQILIMLNPIMPYITEELYASIAQRESGAALISSSWPDYPAALSNEEADQEMDWLQRFISEIRSVRADMNVPASAKIDLLVKDSDYDVEGLLIKHSDVICRMARLTGINLTNEVPRGAIQTVVDTTTLILPIADIIDLDQERTRLKKQIEKLEQNIKKLSQKLENKSFVANAPEEVVEEQRTRIAEDQSVVNKLSAALKQLEEAA
ncbi:MAG: valine--tRNA ligase [Alphaproteobacteria bacterium]|nr:valine--tRNA ligase [Alphaproteobacteria bacterium]